MYSLWGNLPQIGHFGKFFPSLDMRTISNMLEIVHFHIEMAILSSNHPPLSISNTFDLALSSVKDDFSSVSRTSLAVVDVHRRRLMTSLSALECRQCVIWSSEQRASVIC